MRDSQHVGQDQESADGNCPICNGIGMVISKDSDERTYAKACVCQRALQIKLALKRAKIPARYEHCMLDSYDATFSGADSSFTAALMMAKRFVQGYPVETGGQGLLFTGTVGVGKTHLAVGILRALILEKGVHGLFCDYRELLKEIQNSYNPQVSANEMEILNPVLNAEVLVLDELGAAKPTEWCWDTVALILNSRYNDKRTTIITSNYPNKAVSGTSNGNEAPRFAREETLGDRIGERMRSRLWEMCVNVVMMGPDFRQSVARARFG